MAAVQNTHKHLPSSRLRPPRRRAAVLLLAAVLLAAGMAACKSKTTPLPSGKKADAGIQKTFERGPITCKIELDRSEITIADRFSLTISVTIDEAYEVELPPAGEKLAGFGIVDYHTTPPELVENKKKKIIRSYLLEPFLSGEYTIPAMTVRFWKSGEKKKEAHTLKTEDIPIKVTSLLPATLKDMKIHDIQPPVTLPRSMALWVWAGGIAGGLLLLGVFCFYLYQRRRNAIHINAELYLPPHEIAYAALERLVSKNLIEKGEIKLFYQEISDTLRRYIENRFNIHAPEQTTEEFLEGLKSDTRLSAKHQGLLKNFLTHCDLVKFAEHTPSTQDIQNTFDSCKLFIEETKQVETVAKQANSEKAQL